MINRSYKHVTEMRNVTVVVVSTSVEGTIDGYNQPFDL